MRNFMNFFNLGIFFNALKESSLKKIKNLMYVFSALAVGFLPLIRKSWQTDTTQIVTHRIANYLLSQYGAQATHSLFRSAKFTDAVTCLQKYKFCVKSLELQNFNTFEHNHYRNRPEWGRKFKMPTLKALLTLIPISL